MKPDRFNAMVEKVIPHQEDCVAHVHAASLLRRQHQSIVRLVERSISWKTADGAVWISKDSLLAALKRMAR